MGRALYIGMLGHFLYSLPLLLLATVVTLQVSDLAQFKPSSSQARFWATRVATAHGDLDRASRLLRARDGGSEEGARSQINQVDEERFDRGRSLLRAQAELHHHRLWPLYFLLRPDPAEDLISNHESTFMLSNEIWIPILEEEEE